MVTAAGHMAMTRHRKEVSGEGWGRSPLDAGSRATLLAVLTGPTIDMRLSSPSGVRIE